MPRIPYQSGSVASQGVAYAPRRVPDILENTGALGGIIDKAMSSLFYNPENDPRAQQARLYRAQASTAETEAEVANAANRARMGLPEMMSAMTGTPTNRYDTRDELPPQEPGASPTSSVTGDENSLGDIVVNGVRPDYRLTEAQHAEADERDRTRALAQGYQTLISQGVEPEAATTMIGGIAAGWGMDDAQARYRFSGSGTALGKDDAVSLPGQADIRQGNFAQESSVENAKLRSSERENESTLATRRYGFDRGFEADLGVAGINAETSRVNNAEDNETAAGMNSEDNRTSLIANTVDNLYGRANETGRIADDAAARRDALQDGTPPRRAAPAPRPRATAPRAAAPRAAPARPNAPDPLGIR